MCHIIAFKSRQAHNIEGCVDGPEFEPTKGIILSCRDVFDVVLCRDLEPPIFDIEIKVREVIAAYR